MQHLDPDRLVLLALSEEREELTEADHLTHCTSCQQELRSLRDVATVGAEVQDLRDLPAPPEHIWQGIAAGIADSPPDAPVSVAPAVALAGPRRRRDRSRWLTPVLAAAAAAIVAVAGTVAVERFTGRAPGEQVTARATLSPLATVPASAGGYVQVLADGQVSIDVRNLPLTTGFHEVWLLDPDDLTKMVALGNLPDTPKAVLPLPPGTDLNRYRLVDVSDEPHDGDAAHSGNSLLRGTLTK